MNCTHCMVNASPNGKHMEIETFDQVLSFVKRTQPLVVMITGGEPTENPNFFEMIRRLKKVMALPQIVIASNGLFLWNHEMTERVLGLGISIQITNDKRYYPLRINEAALKHPLIFFEDHIRAIYPQGRAVVNGIKNEGIPTKAPKCFNLRSIARNKSRANGGLSDAVRLLQGMQKFCTPSINVDGTISAGESNLCAKIGHVKDSDHTLLQNLQNLKCNRCEQEDILTNPLCRNAIGI